MKEARRGGIVNNGKDDRRRVNNKIDFQIFDCAFDFDAILHQISTLTALFKGIEAR